MLKKIIRWIVVEIKLLLEGPLALVDMSDGPKVDSVDGSSGRFGYDASNPIPVGGRTEREKYLAGLHCPCGEAFQYRRIGSFGTGPDGHVVDGYFLSCCKGSHQIKLYFDIYHRGTTSLIPNDLTLGPLDGEPMAQDPSDGIGFIGFDGDESHGPCPKCNLPLGKGASEKTAPCPVCEVHNRFRWVLSEWDEHLQGLDHNDEELRDAALKQIEVIKQQRREAIADLTSS